MSDALSDFAAATRDLPDSVVEGTARASWRMATNDERPRIRAWWEALALIAFEEIDRRAAEWDGLTAEIGGLAVDGDGDTSGFDAERA